MTQDTSVDKADNTIIMTKEACVDADQSDSDAVNNLECKIIPRLKRRTRGPGGMGFLFHGHESEVVVLNITLLKAHFNMSLRDAAKALGVCATAIKKVCRKVGIKEWPFRKLQTVEKKMSYLSSDRSLKRLSSGNDAPPSHEELQSKIEKLKACRDMLLEGKDCDLTAMLQEDDGFGYERESSEKPVTPTAAKPVIDRSQSNNAKKCTDNKKRSEPCQADKESEPRRKKPKTSSSRPAELPPAPSHPRARSPPASLATHAVYYPAHAPAAAPGFGYNNRCHPPQLPRRATNPNGWEKASSSWQSAFLSLGIPPAAEYLFHHHQAYNNMRGHHDDEAMLHRQAHAAAGGHFRRPAPPAAGGMPYADGGSGGLPHALESVFCALQARAMEAFESGAGGVPPYIPSSSAAGAGHDEHCRRAPAGGHGPAPAAHGDGYAAFCAGEEETAAAPPAGPGAGRAGWNSSHAPGYEGECVGASVGDSRPASAGGDGAHPHAAGWEERGELPVWERRASDAGDDSGEGDEEGWASGSGSASPPPAQQDPFHGDWTFW